MQGLVLPLAVRLWPSLFSSLGLSFPVCNMRGLEQVLPKVEPSFMTSIHILPKVRKAMDT